MAFLPGVRRGELMRYDTAVLLKRFYLCEQAIVVGEAGWLPGAPYYRVKIALPKMLWEDAMTGNALRERVFELRFPSRVLEIGQDQPLLDFLRGSYQAPNAIAFLMLLARVVKPALKAAYEAYLELADEIGDGPTRRFMTLAVEEKARHIRDLEALIAEYAQTLEASELAAADAWVRERNGVFQALGGISLQAPVGTAEVPAPLPFHPAETARRDDTFHNVRFYWPDSIDPSFPYGNGVQLQIRSAVSHLNEVWAVENAGMVMFAFADQLGWEFIYDVARWVYDESRHCQMGYERLKSWGFAERELPLGTYIYDSCQDEDPIYRLGMLFYFETKNIGKKLDRAEEFQGMNDRMSQHDMDFDWADETIHTSYGKKWLTEVLKRRQLDPHDYHDIRDYCESLVSRKLETATQAEVQEIRGIAEGILAKAAQTVR